jgi:hypothetical protein
MPIMKMARKRLVPLTVCLDENNLFFSFKLQALQNVFLNQLLSLVEALYDYLSYSLNFLKCQIYFKI